MVAFESFLPWLPKSFPTHHAYSQASVSEILGTRQSTVVKTATLASTVFLNRKNRFEALPLPRETQYTPIFGIAVADFNLDGFPDMVLAQNFFGTRETDGPFDAGRGLLLMGSASGKLRAISGMESGIVAYGEQRGCAVSDWNQDGRADLALGQNGSQTKIFLNETGPQGIRVKLQGNDTNPNAFGSTLWIDGKSAISQQCGSGYLSQDSAVKILPMGARRIEVLWPTGSKQTYEVSPGIKSLALNPDGKIEGK
jgi:hypothetical protein